MTCSSPYAVCIRRRSCVALWAHAPAIPRGRANRRRLPSASGGSGQSAFAGLYSLSNHCSLYKGDNMSFKPDYGLKLVNDGISKNVDHYVYDFRLYSLTVLGRGEY